MSPPHGPAPAPPPATRSWRAPALLLAFHVATLLVGGLLAGPSLRLAEAWAEADPGSLGSYLAGKGLHRHVDRLRWLAVLVGLPLLLRLVGPWTLARIGLSRHPGAGRKVAGWFAAGAGMSLALVLVHGLASGAVLQPWPGSGRLAALLVTALAGAAAVAFVEEIAFRGVVQDAMRTAVAAGPAVLLTAGFFAIVHFKPAGPPAASILEGWPEPWNWLLAGVPIAAGFLAASVTGLEPVMLLNLILLGTALGLLRARSGSLWPCIGLHAGLVAVLLAWRRLVATPAGGAAWLGSHRLADGLLATIFLAGLVLLVACWPVPDGQPG